MKLYISDDSELIEKDVVEKGWREVLVENEGKCYLIEVLTIDRLNGEYRHSAESGEVMTLDQSTIIADSVAKERVIELLLKVDVSWITVLTPINLDTMFINASKYSQSSLTNNTPRWMKNGKEYLRSMSAESLCS